MKIRTIYVVLALAAAFSVPLFGENVVAGQPDPNLIGKDQAQQLLKEISVDKFEDAAFWRAEMPLDMGVVAAKKLNGSPVEKKPIEEEKNIGIKEEDKNVLGVRVNFFRRGFTYFTVYPGNPIPVEGITKTLSLWVVGRNFNHVLKVILLDYYGRAQEITVGKLNFIGWKKLTVAVPPTIVQSEYHFANRNGIKILGFRVDCDQMESYGTYYVYFDDLRAVTDLFGELKRDSDDMSDGW